MKTGLESSMGRAERAWSSESGPLERIVERVVSKSLPPTFSLIRSWGRGPAPK